MFQKLFIFLIKYRNIFELSVSKTQGYGENTDDYFPHGYITAPKLSA